jgi:cytochrome bd-type quinol oxidase subunit 1
MQAETTKYAVGIPYLGSLILTHSLDGQVKGLKEFAKIVQIRLGILEFPYHGGSRHTHGSTRFDWSFTAQEATVIREKSGSINLH